MPMRSTMLPLLGTGLVLSFVSCASAPSPSAPKPAAVASEKAPPSVNLLCHEAARAVRFDKIGVPAGEWPVDVALSPKSIWVL